MYYHVYIFSLERAHHRLRFPKVAEIDTQASWRSWKASQGEIHPLILGGSTFYFGWFHLLVIPLLWCYRPEYSIGDLILQIGVDFSQQEIILKRAADLAEALYTMPRNNQLSLSAPRSPTMANNGMSSSFNTYTGQLAVSVQDSGNGQWTEGAYPSLLTRWCGPLLFI